jgi:SAM-dependent methyltransferase
MNAASLQSDASSAALFEPSREDVDRWFQPFIRSVHDVDSAEWDAATARLRAVYRTREWRRRLLIDRALGQVRNQRSIEANYTKQWTQRDLDEHLRVDCPGVPFRWKDMGYLACANAVGRIYAGCLARVFETIKPRTVLEVGAGNGQNLFVLSLTTSGISYTGGELTEGGVAAAKAYQAHETASQRLIDYLPLPLTDRDGYKKIDFHRADARSLPFDSGSFDVVFTVLALEQMEEIRAAALSEIARVARRHTIMIEPFWDWNDTDLRRRYVRTNRYFQARVGDLAKFGMHVEYAGSPFPNKESLGVGMVVASKRGAAP